MRTDAINLIEKGGEALFDQNSEGNAIPNDEFLNLLVNLLIESIEKKGAHRGVTCDYCKTKSFKGPRYKCLICPGNYT